MAHVANTTTFAALEGGVAWAMQTLTDPARGKLYFIERNITDVGGKLSAIERNTRGGFNASEGSNTRDVFWWTTWAIVVMLGLFILNLLVRVLAQLVTLNGYQSTFQKMWAEDRANDDRIRREEKRERHIWQMRGLSPQQAAQAGQSDDDSSVDEDADRQ